jgi:hypothetical protein
MIIDYVGISGATPDPAGRSDACTGEILSVNAIQCNNGMMPPFEGKRIRDCRDGTSQTIIVAEQSGQVYSDKASANALGGWFGFGNVWSASQWNASMPLSSITSANAGNTYPGGITSVRYPPNAYWTTSPPFPAYRAASANTVINSYHTGGLHILLADGSSRFLSEYVEMETLRRLCSRDDGQNVGPY